MDKPQFRYEHQKTMKLIEIASPFKSCPILALQVPTILLLLLSSCEAFNL